MTRLTVNCNSIATECSGKRFYFVIVLDVFFNGWKLVIMNTLSAFADIDLPYFLGAIHQCMITPSRPNEYGDVINLC